MRSTRIWIFLVFLAGLIHSNALFAQIYSINSTSSSWDADIWSIDQFAVTPDVGLRPDADTQVVIQTDVTVPISTTLLAGDLVIDVAGNLSDLSGTLTITSGGSLTIDGLITVNSTGVINMLGGNITCSAAVDFDASSTVNFSNGTRTITGGGSSLPVGLGNLNITAGAVRVANSTSTVVRLKGLLSFTGTAVLDADGTGNLGTFIISSSSLTDGGRIGALPSPGTLPTNGNLQGKLTVERFINSTGGTGEWRYLAIPVISGSGGTGSPNVGQLNFPVTGNYSNPSSVGGNVAFSNAPSIYRFANPNSGSADYVAIGSGGTKAATTLSNNTGYVMYTYITGDFTISLTGNPAKGSITIPLGTDNYSLDGRKWNLVPNPYPSPIWWNSITTTGLVNGGTATIYLPKTDGSFSTYVRGAALGSAVNPPPGFSNWRGEVAIGQAFWVENSSASTLALTESSKITSFAQYSREETPENIFRATLKSAASSQKDDVVIYFKETAKNTADEFDGRKRPNGDYISDLGINSYINFSSYSKDDPTKLAISAIPYVTCQSTVKLAVTDVPVGNYSISFSQLETFTKQYEIKLIDHFLNDKETIAANGVEYSFAVTANPASYGLNRFEIVFTTAPLSPTPPAMKTASVCEGTLKIESTDPMLNYQFFAGNTPLSPVVKGTGSPLDISIDQSKLTSGSNSISLKVVSVDGCKAKEYGDALSFVYNPQASISSTQSGRNCGPGLIELRANTSANASSFRWYSSKDSAIPIAGAQSSTYSVNLTESKSFFVSAINASGCETQRYEVIGEIVSLPKPTVIAIGNLLVSSSKVNNQWFKDGLAIAGATDLSYQVTASGVYNVGVVEKGCLGKSENITLAITALADEVITSVEVFPNPVKGVLTVKLPSELEQELRTIVVTDIRGGIIYSTPYSTSGKKSVEVDLSGNGSGLYLLRLLTDKKSFSYKIIKE
jgi:hypothetical protein